MLWEEFYIDKTFNTRKEYIVEKCYTHIIFTNKVSQNDVSYYGEERENNYDYNGPISYVLSCESL